MLFKRDPYRSRNFIELKRMFLVLTALFFVFTVYRWEHPAEYHARMVLVTWDYDYKYNNVTVIWEVEVGLLPQPPDPEPEHEGYQFVGWSYINNQAVETYWDFSTDHVVSDMTLYANWRPR
ncbi:MAG: InlB B-repeat-containing protein [Clostridia bacterium]|nr:InlB B-repeat-containing protein [Clostridia bacterium]